MMAEDDIDLQDMPIEARRKLAYNHPLLDAQADQVSNDIGIPGIVTALKNAGEKSQSGSVSPKGAQGVMQFMPETGKRYGLTDPTDPVAAIAAAGKYVADISKKLGTKDPALIAAAYNAGENRKDILAGKIPLIPETQKYVTRVKGWMSDRGGDGSSDGVDPADLPGGGVDASDLPSGGGGQTQDDIARQYASPRPPPLNSEPGQASPIRKVWTPFGTKELPKVGPGMANFLASVDKGVTDPVIGASQRLRELTNKALGTQVFDMGQSYRDTKNRNAYDSPMLGTKAGMAGYLTGAGIDTALTGGVGKGVLSALAAGAGSGYAMPTENEDDAAKNAGIGGALGAATFGLGRGVSRLADTAPAQAVLGPLKDAVNKVAVVPKVLQKSLSASMSGPQRDAVNTALKEEVPVYGKQLAKPGFELPDSLREQQRSGFDRALNRSVGENTDDMNAAWQAAHANLSDRYDKLLSNKQIPLDFSHLADVSGLIAQNAAREPRFAANKEVQQALERAFDAAQSGTPLSGRDYQQALREYGGLATKLFKGTPENPSDPYSAKLVLRLMGSLEDQAGQALGPKELREFKDLNRMWRNKSQLESLVPKDLSGHSDPRALARKLANSRPEEFMYGTGDQTLPNLAKFGSSYMDLNNTNKPGLGRKVWGAAKTIAPMTGAGWLEGEVSGGIQADKSPVDTAVHIGGMGAAAALTGLALRAYKKQAVGGQLTRAEFEALRGALPSAARSMVSPGALTRTIEAEHGSQE